MTRTPQAPMQPPPQRPEGPTPQQFVGPPTEKIPPTGSMPKKRRGWLPWLIAVVALFVGVGIGAAGAGGASAELDAANAEIAALEANLADVQAESATLEDSLAEAELTIASSDEAVAAREEELDAREARLDARKERLDNRENRLDDLAKEAESNAAPAPSSGGPTAGLVVGSWKILGEIVPVDDGLGDFEATFRVQNIGDTQEEPWLTVSVLNGNDVLSAMDCMGNNIAPGASGTVECMSVDPFQTGWTEITVEDAGW